MVEKKKGAGTCQEMIYGNNCQEQQCTAKILFFSCLTHVSHKGCSRTHQEQNCDSDTIILFLRNQHPPKLWQYWHLQHLVDSNRAAISVCCVTRTGLLLNHQHGFHARLTQPIYVTTDAFLEESWTLHFQLYPIWLVSSLWSGLLL